MPPEGLGKPDWVDWRGDLQFFSGKLRHKRAKKTTGFWGPKKKKTRGLKKGKG